MKTGYKPRTSLDEQPVSMVTTLPTDEPVAAYYRQSSMGQVGNISTAIQTVDMVEYLKQRGWSGTDITLIDMDEGISGTKKIEDRPGMRHLYDLISQRKIRTVACVDEDRLFRDITMIQVDIFIEACKQASVLVMTPSMIYDFANPHMGTYHARQFRFKCEMAAEYLNTYMLGKLKNAKHRQQMEGKWVGTGMPVGYMVDMRERLPNGSINPDCKRFVPFEPYALVLREYFDLFLKYAGNVHALMRHIYQLGPFLPDPETTPAPDGFTVDYRSLTRKNGHYVPSRSALLNMLTNVVYIGCWTVKDAIVRKDNHPAIVPLDVFMRVYNYLSETDFEGNPNPHFMAIRQYSHPDKAEARAADEPLCAGMIYTDYAGESRRVGAIYEGRKRRYSYELRTPLEQEYVWSKTAQTVDDQVVALVRRKVSASFDDSAWKQALDELKPDLDRTCKLKKAELKALDQAIEHIKLGLEVLTNADLIRDSQAKYEERTAQRAQIIAELSAAQEDRAELDALYELKDRCVRDLEEWDTISQDERRAVVHGLIERIEAAQIGKGAIQFTVYWRDNGSDNFTVGWKTSHGSRRWLPSELKRLMELVDSGASQEEICAAFPDRTWQAIYARVYHRGERPFVIGKTVIRQRETYNQYLQRRALNMELDTPSSPAAPGCHVAGNRPSFVVTAGAIC